MKPQFSVSISEQQARLLDFLSGRATECSVGLHLRWGCCERCEYPATLVYENAVLTNQVTTEPTYSWLEKAIRRMGRILRITAMARYHERDTITTCDFVAERVYKTGA